MIQPPQPPLDHTPSPSGAVAASSVSGQMATSLDVVLLWGQAWSQLPPSGLQEDRDSGAWRGCLPARYSAPRGEGLTSGPAGGALPRAQEGCSGQRMIYSVLLRVLELNLNGWTMSLG